MPRRRLTAALAASCLVVLSPSSGVAQQTQKPPLHGQDWMAVTGKPLGAAAGAKVFLKGGNAVDAACAMIAATATMWDVLHWGGETQALVWDPRARKVIGVNALGVAPTGATAEFFRSKGMDHPPPYGPLAAVTPGTPGGIMSRPGRIMLNSGSPARVRKELGAMGYDPVFRERTSGPVNAILLDHRHGTLWGASSNHGEDYGIGW